MVRVAIWDLPVRIVHWALVAAIAFSWWSAENERMDWHRLSGYAVLALVVFRLFWGFVGSDTARFATFLRGPRAILAYLRGHETGPAARGHNPLGGWSVVAMLAAIALQVVLGLFAVDVDGIESGPLSAWAEFDTGRAAAELHEWLFNILLMLIVLHVAAILFYLLVKRRNLVSAMLTGHRSPEADPAYRFAPLPRALVGVLLAAAVAWLVAQSFYL